MSLRYRSTLITENLQNIFLIWIMLSSNILQSLKLQFNLCIEKQNQNITLSVEQK